MFSRNFAIQTVIAFLLLLQIYSIQAHDPFEGTTTLRLQTNSIDLAITLNGRTAQSLCNEPDLNSMQFSPELFSNNLSIFKNSGANLFEISAAGEKLIAFETNAFLGKENDVEYRLRYPCPPGALMLKADYLNHLPHEGYGAVLTVLDMVNNVVVGQKLLTGDEISFAVKEMPNAPPPISTNAIFQNNAPANTTIVKPEPKPELPQFPPAWQFLKLGIFHILTGYDHLLFLCGLLIICKRISSIIVIITCFTIAHSVTLALAALNIANLSSRIVEPTIAATIVFVGIENLVQRGEPKWRGVAAFVFGLVHGFGFAGALKEIGLGANGTPFFLPLISFNLGVEIGQIIVAVVFLSLLWQLRKWKLFARYGTQVISITVSLIGAYWFFERVFFP